MGEEENIPTMESRILEKLSREFNNKIKEFFAKEFDSKLEKMVELKMGDLLNQSSQNISVLDQTIPKNDHEARLLTLEDRENENKEQMEKLVKDLQTEKKRNSALVEENTRLLAKVEESRQASYNEDRVAAVEKKLKTKLSEQVDSELAKRLQKEEETKEIAQNFQAVKEEFEHVHELIDNIEAQGRKDVLQLLRIPYEGDRHRRENTTKVVLGFLQYHLGIRLREQDISVCHRQDIPDERKKMGRRYIPPIYCKLVQRSVARYILDRWQDLGRGKKSVWGLL